jgi:hypothetical protein
MVLIRWVLLGFSVLGGCAAATPAAGPTRGDAVDDDAGRREAGEPSGPRSRGGPSGALAAEEPSVNASASVAASPTAAPVVVVDNALLVAQFVWLDDELLGRVEPRGTARFAVAPGAHAVAFTDRDDRGSNPGFAAEVFETGVVYHYEVVTR